MKYRKKPVEIDAIQWMGDNEGEVSEFIGVQAEWAESPDYLLIHTLEGTMRADLGDWIIRGVKGEFYPCKPDIFEATYKPVGDIAPDYDKLDAEKDVDRLTDELQEAVRLLLKVCSFSPAWDRLTMDTQDEVDAFLTRLEGENGNE